MLRSRHGIADRRPWRRWAVALTLLATCGAGPFAQPAFPTKPIRLVVAGPAGGGADLVARALARRASELLGQQLIIDNRAGANGQLAAEAVATAAADGYTLLLATTSALALNPNIGAVTYDPFKSFAPVSLLATSPLLLVVHPSLPAKTVTDVVTYAKRHPGQLNYASNGLGSLSHLATELFKAQAGVDMVHVPYKGGSQAVNDTISGQTTVLITAFPTVLSQVRNGRLRAIAVTSERRASTLPEVPSMAESGLGHVVATQWYAVYSPAGTPAAIVDRVNAAIRTALASAEVKDVFAREGLEAVGSTPQELASFFAQDYARWAKVVQSIQLKRN